MTTACAKKKAQNYPGQLKPGSAEYYLNQGILYLNAGNIDLAEKNLLQALKKNPSLVGAINGMGIVYLNRREFDKAVRNFRRVISLNPNSFDAYNYLGVIFTETNKYELARENFLVAANAEKYRTPENAYANLARLELTQNKLDSAMRYVEKGLEKNKSFAPLYNLKGIIFETKEEYKKSLYYYEKALSLLTVEDVSYLVNIGRLYSKMGEKNKALDTLERALSKAYSPQLKDQINKLIKEVEKM
jgi:Tfp pilus assembly protein PilF